MRNLFEHPDVLPGREEDELFEAILGGLGGLLVERIVSNGQTTPEDVWYDQEKDEWVAVLEGEARLRYADGSEISLAEGDSVFLPKHVRHQVSYTSSPCVWLAIHGDALRELDTI